MIDFVAGRGLQPKFAKRIKTAFAVLAGCWVGALWGKIQWARRSEWCNDKNITPYECEDHVNSLIEQTNRPAVIYYYLPMTPHHYLYRSYMMKYSNKYPEKAAWVMVNLTQHLQQAKEGLRSAVFPLNHARIQVRFPKTELVIYEQNQKEETKLAKETVGHRREMYNYDYYQTDFEAFLEQNGVIPGQDPILPVLKLTEKALFDD